jgi:Protein of unknown function (DUF3365)
MGLRAKLNLAILMAFAVGFLLAANLVKSFFIDNARKQVLQNARVMIKAADSIRKYTEEELEPRLPKEYFGKFVKQTVPSYAAQYNLKYVQAAFPDYIYREAALNPTNRSDLANKWEAEIIGEFRNERAKTELESVRDTPTGRALVLAAPIWVRKLDCLTCHDTADKAPATLRTEYGNENGFGWKLNETIGAQILSVQMSVPLELARDAYDHIIRILLATFAVVFVIFNLLLRYLVLAPATRVPTIADAVSLGEEHVEYKSRE